jgi:hypothetical protein
MKIADQDQLVLLGNFIAVNCCYLPHVSDARMAEDLAMNMAYHLWIIWVITKHKQNHLMEVINACLGRERWWSEATAIFVNCMTPIASIGQVEFKHCSREANEAAHEIASFCYSCKSDRN